MTASYRTPARAAAPAEEQKASPKNRSDTLVGQRVKVYWPAEKEWYCGVIKAVDGKGKHYISYDDGDAEWANLAKEQYELLKGASPCNLLRCASRRRIK